jgi:hypothetical protein
MSTYGKSIMGFLGALALVVIPLVTGDNHIDPSEWLAIIIAAAQLALVYLIPLAPGARWVKTAISFVITVAQVLTTIIIGGIDGNDVAILITTVLTFFGIAVAGAVSALPTGNVTAKTGLGD